MLKSHKVTAVFGCFAVVVLSGCALDHTRYETEPVKLQTAKGVVTCQLYTENQVIWDEAIEVPAGMSIEEGDRICLAEGKRRLRLLNS